jgi:prephenate dehydratase
MTLASHFLHDRTTHIGLQGGPGSFNEGAAREKLSNEHITRFDLSYFYTTKRTLEALADKTIDLAHFALYNSEAGPVDETLACLGSYPYQVIDTFTLKIEHHLLSRRGRKIQEMREVMAHPQALMQCRRTLEQRHPQLKKTVGAADFIDPSRIAQGIINQELDSAIAVIGSTTLAQLYDLEVLDSCIQDSMNNYTTFLWVARKDA